MKDMRDVDAIDALAADYINDELYLQGLDVLAPRNLPRAIPFAKSFADGVSPSAPPRCEKGP